MDKPTFDDNRRMVARLDRPKFTACRDDSHQILQCVIAYNAHGGFCIPLASRHRHAAQLILAGEIHEPGTIQFISANCGDGDIVHAGTYFGDFLPALSRSCATGSMIWAFEPNRENHRCAQITTQINGLENITLTHAGLGHRPEEVDLAVSDFDGKPLGGASRVIHESDAPGTSNLTRERVQILTIDDIIPADRDVSVIHLDVEGCEQSALAGALKTIGRCRPIIIVETLPSDDWLADCLFPLGYEIRQRVHGNAILTSEPHA